MSVESDLIAEVKKIVSEAVSAGNRVKRAAWADLERVLGDAPAATPEREAAPVVEAEEGAETPKPRTRATRA